MRYEIWVEYVGQNNSHLHPQRVYEIPRFWRRKNALKSLVRKQEYHDGIMSIVGKPRSFEYYVVDRWVDSEDHIGVE